MHGTIEIDTTQHLATVTIGRDSTVEEVKELLHAFFDHPNYEAGMEAVWDFRNTSLAKTSAAELSEMVDFLGQIDDRRGVRIALVVAADVDFGVLRMYEAFADTEAPQVRRFIRSFEEAVQWLRPN